MRYKLNFFYLLIFYFFGFLFMIIWSKNNYYVATFSNKDFYQNNSNNYSGNFHPDILLYAIKYETFVNGKTDINDLFLNLDKNYKNYGSSNFLKFYNALLKLNKKQISAQDFFMQLEETKKFHRYSDSFSHIAIQAYANIGDLRNFSVILEDYFYKNLKHTFSFNLKRENVSLSILKIDYSGLGFDFENKKLLIQLSEKDANFILNNSLENYSCTQAELFILKEMAPKFKIFYSSTVSFATQKNITDNLFKTLSQLTALCQPRSFIFN